MADLEEGEIADSDSDVSLQTDTSKNVYTFGLLTSKPDSLPRTEAHIFRKSETINSPPPKNFGFRSAPRNGDCSDEDSVDTSDEDSALWNCKRTKYLNKLKMEGIEPSTRSQSPQFINPLRDKHTSSPVLQPPKKKSNNIWGAVLQEQTLTQTMVSFGVDKDEDIELEGQDRDVESYNFKKAREDKRPFVHDEDEMDRSDDDLFGGVVDLDPDEEKEKERERHKRKRRRPAKSRLGQKSNLDKLGEKLMREQEKSKLGDVKNRLGSRHENHKKGGRGPRSCPKTDVTEDDSVPDVVDALVEVLDEPKVDLITRVVKRLGQKKSIQLMRMTEDIEGSGGMMVKDGSRRRSPGGVFFQLLKADQDVSKADVKYIFEDSDRRFLEERKRRKADTKAYKKRLQQHRMDQLARLEQAKLEKNGQDQCENVENSMDHDVTGNGVHKASEGEVTPDAFSDQEKISPDSTGYQDKLSTSNELDLDDSNRSSGRTDEDMLTITVDEEESFD